MSDDVNKTEKYYDDHIAPKLRELAAECAEHGLSLLAVCEWAPGEFGRTLELRAGSGIGIRLADLAAQANGNIDGFMMAVMRHARTNGHSSMILSQLGIPNVPTVAATNKDQQ